MTIRVPLISPMTVVIARLDIPATWSQDPPGDDYDQGYDPIMEQPIISRSSGVRSVPRGETSEVKIPCQVETQSFEELRSVFGGDDPVTNQVFVLHRADLENLGLLDPSTRDCMLKPGDRIVRLEKNGRTTKTFQRPLYIYEVRMGSQGFGPDGYDLELVYTSYRSSDPRGS